MSAAERIAVPLMRRLAAGVALAFLAGPAFAAVDCSTSVPALAFGTYDPTLNTPTDVAGSMTVTCTRVPFDAFTVSYLERGADDGGGASASSGASGSTSAARATLCARTRTPSLRSTAPSAS